MLLVILFFHFQFINLEKVISEFFKMCSNVWKLGAGFVITNSTDYSMNRPKHMMYPVRVYIVEAILSQYSLSITYPI